MKRYCIIARTALSWGPPWIIWDGPTVLPTRVPSRRVVTMTKAEAEEWLPYFLPAREANALLFALDYYCRVNDRGKLTKLSPYGFGYGIGDSVGYSLEQLQAIRDKLFAIHEHPDEE